MSPLISHSGWGRPPCYRPFNLGLLVLGWFQSQHPPSPWASPGGGLCPVVPMVPALGSPHVDLCLGSPCGGQAQSLCCSPSPGPTTFTPCWVFPEPSGSNSLCVLPPNPMTSLHQTNRFPGSQVPLPGSHIGRAFGWGIGT